MSLADYHKMGNFRVVQFLQYFVISCEPRKLESAKSFPSMSDCLFGFIQNSICVFICVHKTPFFIV